jgi:hypothetical protein
MTPLHFVATAFVSITIPSIDAFGNLFFVAPTARKQISYPQPWVQSNSMIRPTISSLMMATTEDDQLNGSKRSESPLGVRRRVKAALAKAKSRTGINNSSDDHDNKDNSVRPLYSKIKTQQTASNVIANAASIGGLGDENDSVELSYDYKRLPTPPRTVRDPASTMSPVIKSNKNPEDVLVLRNSPPRRQVSTVEVDAIRSDIPAAYADPLPFTLPVLSSLQKQRLAAGERVQEQSKMGGEGSGYVVLDVQAPPFVVWECLLDFESYPTTIPTVRDVRFFSSENLKSGYIAEKPVDPSTGRELRHYGTPSTTRAAFILSKFRLNIAAIHNYRPHPDGHYMVFTLDPECTNVVLQSAKGIWYTQTNPDGKGEVCFKSQLYQQYLCNELTSMLSSS